ncbi:MAG: NYN domain-containing protein, partial [Ignavibacteria bacterium]
GRFKEKNVFCHKCKSNIIKHEEKETDVAISIKMFEILYKNECDAVVIMTGDTDITPAIKTSKVLFPEKKIISCFPFKRNNKELESITDFSFNINKDLYLKFQLPDPYIKKDGTPIYKPSKW